MRDGRAKRPPGELVERVVFFGSFISRDDLPEVTRRSLVDFVRVNWPLAAQMLAGLILPHASGDEIAALSRHKRRAADAETAAAFLASRPGAANAVHATSGPSRTRAVVPAIAARTLQASQGPRASRPSAR